MKSFTHRSTFPLALLVGAILLVTAYGYQLDKLELVFSQNGVATGVSYTDAMARIPGLDVLTAIAAIAAAFLVGAAVTRFGKRDRQNGKTRYNRKANNGHQEIRTICDCSK